MNIVRIASDCGKRKYTTPISQKNLNSQWRNIAKLYHQQIKQTNQYTYTHKNSSIHTQPSTPSNLHQNVSLPALVGSLAMGTTFIVSPISGVLTDLIGLRTTTFLGGAISSGGMFLSSFCTDNIEALYFTYGIMYGFGGALAYTPSLAILGHYFKRYIGIVNGVVTAGSASFTIVMPYVIDFFIRNYGINCTLRVLALFAAFIMGCAMLFKPANKSPKGTKKKKASLSSAFNVSIWKNRKYVVWAVVIPLSLFGYFVPYVHMLKFVEDNFSKDYDGKIPVICMGITSGVGRLVFGYIADKPRVNRILLQQISFVSIGLLTLLLPTASGSFTWLLIIALAMGLFDGCFISLLGPIAFDICGQSGATQAIGFLLGLCSIPLTVGPYAAGVLYDSRKSYALAFRLAGIPPIVGGFAMFLIRVVKVKTPAEERNGSVRENGERSQDKLVETGRLLRKDGVSSSGFIWCEGGGRELMNTRCYSYSIL